MTPRGWITHFALAAGLAGQALAGNPVVENKGLCDPSVRIFDDRAYVYASHDFAPDNTKFKMTDWWVWSSPDLLHWNYKSTLRPEDTYYGKPYNDCWATDGIGHKGQYYVYFSQGRENVGVVVGPTPTGPWKDPLGKPLLPKGLTHTAQRDPAIFQEADGTTYIVFGCWDYYIARLNDDMISLAETPRKIEFDRVEGPYGPGKTDDKPYLHRYGSHYYLSWGCYYAMSDNPYGPYTYKRCIITPERTEKVFQRELTVDRHGCFFEWYHQWYFMCNDRDYPGASHYFRDSVLTYVHYHDNGEIEPVYLNRNGVAQYDAADGTEGRIEAENYYDLRDAVKTDGPEGGFEMRAAHDGSYLKYPNVRNLRADTPSSLRVACGAAAGATIEVHRDAPDGKLLGTCRVPGTRGSAVYQTVTCQLHNTTEQQDVFLVFRGGKANEVEAGDLCRLDWFCFNRLP